MHKLRRHCKRHYRKLAAIAGAAAVSAAIIHGVPLATHLPVPAAKPLGAQEAPPAPGAALPTETGLPLGEQIAIPTVDGVPIAAPSPGKTAPAVNPKTAAEDTAAEAAKPPAEKADPEEAGKKAIDMTATAYAPGPQDNDQWGSKTHLGTQVRPGVIAVDPRVIPLGSRVMIKYPDGHKEYAVAEDTGGAIKGHRIDVAKWTVREADQFGIKAVKVYVMETPAEKNQPGV